MHWLAPPPEAAPRDLVARPPTRRKVAPVDTAQQSTASPHTSSHGSPPVLTRDRQTPASTSRRFALENLVGLQLFQVVPATVIETVPDLPIAFRLRYWVIPQIRHGDIEILTHGLP